MTDYISSSPTYSPVSTITSLTPHALKSSRAEVSAAMTLVSAGSNHRATSSLIYANGQAVCVQGALLVTLGYPFDERLSYCGGYRDVAFALSMEDDKQLKNALAVAQCTSDARVEWQHAGRLFDEVLTGRIELTDAYKEIDRLARTGTLHTTAKFIEKMNKLNFEISQVTAAIKENSAKIAALTAKPTYYPPLSLKWIDQPITTSYTAPSNAVSGWITTDALADEFVYKEEVAPLAV